MNRTVYTLLYTLALPLMFLRLCWRSFKDTRYRQRWSERLAYYPTSRFAKNKPNIVFHVVSVGEFHAAIPLIRACMMQNPDWMVTVTTMTVTGSARVREVFADSVQHCYLPYDTPSAVKRFLKALQPRVLVLMETELWPNLIHYAHRQDCRLLLLNARLSEQSFRRYQKHAALSRSMLENLDTVAAQFKKDADRFERLGLSPHKLEVAGTMKFDQAADAEQLKAGQAFRQDLARPVLVAGSTREGEEIKVLSAFKQVQEQIPELLLVLVPRHPERIGEVSRLLREQEMTFVLRSSRQMPRAKTQVLLGDSMGEMPFYYACADVVFVGGSLVATGGQNIIEPALLGRPVVYGPSSYNFESVTELLKSAGGLQQVADEAELAQVVLQLLQNTQSRMSMVAAAQQVVAQEAGASQRQLALIQQAMHSDQ